MKTLRNIIAPFLFVFLIASPVLVATTPFAGSASAAVSVASCQKPFLGIPPWYNGLVQVSSNGLGCDVISPDAAGGLQTFITKIILNIIGIVLALTGYIAFFFILFGGFQFLTGGSNAPQIEKARKTILNAVIGLVISIGAIAVVNLVFRIITP